MRALEGSEHLLVRADLLTQLQKVTECLLGLARRAGGRLGPLGLHALDVCVGEAFQFDWSEEGLVIGVLWRKVQLAHMKLCASRAFGSWPIPAKARTAASRRAGRMRVAGSGRRPSVRLRRVPGRAALPCQPGMRVSTTELDQ